MKVIFVDLPISHEQFYGDWDISPLDTICPPLGLLYIAGYVRAHGHQPSIVDIPNLKWSIERAADHVVQEKPDAVGISAKTPSVRALKTFTELLRNRGLACPIILGGAHVTAAAVETLERFPAIDVGVLGEGEATCLEVLDSLESARPLDDVRGIVWRHPLHGIRKNPPRDVIPDLDVLPFPAWDLLTDFPRAYPHSLFETKRTPAASVITSRGCPFHCTFCDTAVFGSRVRFHSPDYTLRMLRHLIDQYGIRDVMFYDDNFFINREHMMGVCDGMIEQKLDLTWYCLAHEKTMKPDRLARAREAGLWFIEMGVESGSDRILKEIQKKTTSREIAEAATEAKSFGIKTKGNFIFGLPLETRETLQETIDFAVHSDLSYVQQSFLTIWPGSPVSHNFQQYGAGATDWDQLGQYKVTFLPHGLTADDLLSASKEFFRRFYLRPRIMAEVARTLTSWHAMKSAAICSYVFMKTITRPSRGGEANERAVLPLTKLEVAGE
jgi:anaerobic magnesium-protoporphyrin IX monomethyl ester cyclase